MTFIVKVKNGRHIFDMHVRATSQKDADDYMEFEGIPNGDMSGHEILSTKFEVIRGETK